MSSWPGIPSGRGSTCIEEGCGNERRARGNDCRACYRRKWMRHKRACEADPNSWIDGVTEVAFTPTIEREMDRAAHAEWRRVQDEHT